MQDAGSTVWLHVHTHTHTHHGNSTGCQGAELTNCGVCVCCVLCGGLVQILTLLTICTAFVYPAVWVLGEEGLEAFDINVETGVTVIADLVGKVLPPKRALYLCNKPLHPYNSALYVCIIPLRAASSFYSVFLFLPLPRKSLPGKDHQDHLSSTNLSPTLSFTSSPAPPPSLLHPPCCQFIFTPLHFPSWFFPTSNPEYTYRCMYIQK